MSPSFVTGDPRYDELPWVAHMLEKTNHQLVIASLTPAEVHDLAESVQYHQDEPFGGLPTLAYAKLFAAAKEHGVTVLLDGNGMDEQWAGYDYYRMLTNGHRPGIIQGTTESPVRPDCLVPEFRALAEPSEFPAVFRDKLRNTQYRDAVRTKIPRAMLFNDRISMRSSRELREPFLDDRLFELLAPADGQIDVGMLFAVAPLARGLMTPLMATGIAREMAFLTGGARRDSLPRGILDELFAHVRRMHPRVIGTIFASWVHHSAEEALPEIAAPAIIFAGGMDQLTPPALAEVMASRMPRATRRVVPGHSHLLQLERPELVHREVDGWLLREGLAAE